MSNPGEWYMVAFRSTRRPDVDEARLTAHDDWAHAEAMEAPGFVHYFKGPTQDDGQCMSFCLWDSRAEARAAAGRPAHTAGGGHHPRDLRRVHARIPPRDAGRRRVASVRDLRRQPAREDRRADSPAGAQPEAGTVLTRASTIGSGARSIGPGLAAAIAVAIVARLLTGFLPSIVAEVSVALLLGIVVASLAGPRVRPLTPGLAFSSQRILRLGIVLLGARLSLAEIARIGLPATGLIVVTMAASFAIVLVVARLVHVDDRLAVLIAVGSAVCGNTAIVATAPVIGARAREVAYAVATITLFGTLAVFLYPTIGRAVGLLPDVVGLWAGVAVHDTSQVIATGAAFGPEALDVATVVKLIRNALMAPLLFLIAAVWAGRADSTGGVRPACAGVGVGSGGPSRCSSSASSRSRRCGPSV